MTELDNAFVTVTNSTVDSFELLGIDSTSFKSFVAHNNNYVPAGQVLAGAKSYRGRPWTRADTIRGWTLLRWRCLSARLRGNRQFTEYLVNIGHTEETAAVYAAMYDAFFCIGGPSPSKFVEGAQTRNTETGPACALYPWR